MYLYKYAKLRLFLKERVGGGFHRVLSLAAHADSRAGTKPIAEVGSFFIDDAFGGAFSAIVMGAGLIALTTFARFGVTSTTGATVRAAIVERGERLAAMPTVARYLYSVRHKDTFSCLENSCKTPSSSKPWPTPSLNQSKRQDFEWSSFKFANRLQQRARGRHDRAVRNLAFKRGPSN